MSFLFLWLTLLFGSSSKSVSLAEKFAYDEWLISRFLHYIPEIENFLQKMELPPSRYIRVNTLKTSVSELTSRLKEKGFTLENTVIAEVLRVAKAPSLSIGATSEYLLGHYYVQDLSSCIAVQALDVQKNHSVLDMASAPGGKTSYIAQKMQNTGSIVALEPNPKRARSMLFNLDRLGVINTCVFYKDGLEAKNLGQFDRVLLDAPCSCEGVIAKDKTRKTSHVPKDVDFCASRQELLLEIAIKACTKEGIVVYSTCSFAPEENEAILDKMIHKFNVTIEPLPFGSPGLESFGDFQFDKSVVNARRLYPHMDDTTGFFVAKLRMH